VELDVEGRDDSMAGKEDELTKGTDGSSIVRLCTSTNTATLLT
jgi:hypothetical protein